MNKKALLADIIKMIENMETNKFLLPDSWSPEIQMATQDILYKTYVGSRGINRYMHIVVTKQDRIVDIHISGNKISCNSEVFSKVVTPKEVHELVSAVYNEKYSFVGAASKLVEMRKEIAKKRAEIRRAAKELKESEEVLEDYLKLNKKGK